MDEETVVAPVEETVAPEVVAEETVEVTEEAPVTETAAPEVKEEEVVA